MADSGTLEQVRADIDAIDQEIQALINRRARCAQRVAAIKLEDAGAPGCGARRRREVVYYRRARGPGTAPHYRVATRSRWRAPASPIVSRNHVACLALERHLQVAYLGPEGTFTQAASLKHFGHAAVCVPQATIDTVFAQVESGRMQLRRGAGRELHRRHGQPHAG